MRTALFCLAAIGSIDGCPSEVTDIANAVASFAKEAEAAAPATDQPASSVAVGKAVWYGGKWHGRKTASGERFDKEALTAAHRSLPFGTRVRVTNTDTKASVIVRINDRGPYGKNRSHIIDVSEAAARTLDFNGRGAIPVRLEILND